MILPPWAYPAALAAVCVAFLPLALAPFVVRPRGPLRHRYHLGMLALALPGPLLALLFAIMGLVETPTSASDELTYMAALGISAGVGLPLCWEVLRFGFATTPEGLEAVSPWRGRWFIPWGEIDAVSYGFGWFAVESRTRGTFRIPLMATNLDGFLAACEGRLKVEQLTRAIRGYTGVGRRFPGTEAPRVLGRGDLRRWNEGPAQRPSDEIRPPRPGPDDY